MAEEKSLSAILAEQINEVSGGIEASLKRHLAAMPLQPVLSDAVKKQIAKRVPPKTLDANLTPEAAISLAAMELADLGTRISHYQHIERYREHFNPPNVAMRAAFVMHTHILRGSEIYVIMEQCVSFLTFFYDLAEVLDLGPTNTAKSLEKQFKKEFDRHLRERHRIVHAHERPSLVSRMIGVPPQDLADPKVIATYALVINQLSEMIGRSMGDAMGQKTPEEALASINALRLKAVDEECLKMWSILIDCINRLIDTTKLRK